MITNVCAIWLAKQQLCNTVTEFVVPFSSRSQVVMKQSSNDTFFVQKEVLGEKIIILLKYGNVFTQRMMFSL